VSTKKKGRWQKCPEKGQGEGRGRETGKASACHGPSEGGEQCVARKPRKKESRKTGVQRLGKSTRQEWPTSNVKTVSKTQGGKSINGWGKKGNKNPSGSGGEGGKKKTSAQRM